MMELEAGERKKARKYILRGLEAPTENTLAQVFWAKENKHLTDGYDLDQLVRTAEDAYEADYRLNLQQGNLLAALPAARTWGTDEPFAARPRSEIAFVASLLDDHNLTVEMANAVYLLDGQKDPTLEMNAIFATLSSGKLTPENDSQKIEKLQHQLIRAIEQRKDDAYHAMAAISAFGIIGMAAKRLGRELYQKAIGIAEKFHMLEAAALAATFAAREAILSRDPASTTILQQAKDLTKRSKNMTSEFYLRKLDALRHHPDKADEILSPASAQNFLKVSKPAPTFRVEKHGKGLVLIVRRRNNYAPQRIVTRHEKPQPDEMPYKFRFQA